MLKSQISHEELLEFANRLKEEFRLELLVEGLEYQQKGWVYNAEVNASKQITGRVLTLTGPVEVMLDFDFIATSQCSCDSAEYCSHMAALFFYIFAAYGHPDRFVRELTAPKTATEDKPLLKKAAVAASAAAVDPKSLPRVFPLEWGKSPPQPGGWELLLKKTAERFEEEQRASKRPSPSTFYKEMLAEMERSASRFTLQSQQLYTLAGLFIVIEEALDWTRSSRSTRPYYEPEHVYLTRLLEPLFARFHQMVSPSEASKLRLAPPSLDEAVRETRRIIRSRALRSENDGIRWIDFYRLVWLHPLNRIDWVQQEIATISEEESAPPALTRLLIAHLLYISKKDDTALELLSSLAPVPWTTLMLIMSNLVELGEWDRLRWWLGNMPQLLPTNGVTMLNQLHPFWSVCSEHLDCEADWLELLGQHSPHSNWLYADALFTLGRYREWVSFHMAQRLGMDDADRTCYKELEGKHPELLLPWLHQEAERYILQKNRSAYRMAIRLIKRLRTLYKKLKRNEEFEAYVDVLSGQFGRLRAFQEELRKGKLLG